MNAIQRFWSKVNKGGPTPAHRPELGPCWVWTASKRNKGYGAFFWRTDSGEKVQGRAHRFSWELHHGAIPEGQCALHHCDNPGCVRPGHLFLGTIAENNQDMVSKGRHVPGGTHHDGNYEHGEKHHNAKLTADKVIEIRTLKATLSYSQLSERFGLAIGHLHRIVHNKVWKGIKGRGLSS